MAHSTATTGRKAHPDRPDPLLASSVEISSLKTSSIASDFPSFGNDNKDTICNAAVSSPENSASPVGCEGLHILEPQSLSRPPKFLPSAPDPHFTASSSANYIRSADQHSPFIVAQQEHPHPLVSCRHPKPAASADEILRMNLSQLADMVKSREADDDEASNTELLYPPEL
ncbi:hypothetical protein CVT26_004411 [Gymnopilus dilepis]|uniref:Uncharacterized protein n=1 Tax=Gymnopilus dilepis TaxID=231916 RepID=A0A409X2Z6_9AGAR|nr:hypothetical protein CVT26_004411 [Gymnopilus dilepis]